MKHRRTFNYRMNKKSPIRIFPLFCLTITLIFIGGCTPQMPVSETVPPSTAMPSLIPEFTLTPIATPPVATITTIPRQSGFCSPLSGIEITELPDIVSNPFVHPRPGFDDGHQGTDFSFFQYKGLNSIQGLPVDAVLSGKVIAVINDRPPYGNFVILETPINQIPYNLLESDLPAPALQSTPSTHLSCPDIELPSEWKSTELSLYILYAHLNRSSILTKGMTINCGDTIGEVGNSGYSSNPHLHLEMRIGPSGASFDSMAHLINNATPQEIESYCIWRVSGFFQLIDPMTILLAP